MESTVDFILPGNDIDVKSNWKIAEKKNRGIRKMLAITELRNEENLIAASLLPFLYAGRSKPCGGK